MIKDKSCIYLLCNLKFRHQLAGAQGRSLRWTRNNYSSYQKFCPVCGSDIPSFLLKLESIVKSLVCAFTSRSQAPAWERVMLIRGRLTAKGKGLLAAEIAEIAE